MVSWIEPVRSVRDDPNEVYEDWKGTKRTPEDCFAHPVFAAKVETSADQWRIYETSECDCGDELTECTMPAVPLVVFLGR